MSDCPTCPPCSLPSEEDLSKFTIKSFSTLLKSDDKSIRYQSSAFSGSKKKFKVEKELPPIFNPTDAWGFFLTSVKTQGKCGACWAMASAKALSDRYSILTFGRLIEDFSPYAMVTCQGTIFPGPELDKEAMERINLDAHTSGACNGNTLYNSLDYLYSIGCVTSTCINYGLFKDKGIPDITTIDDPKNVPMCSYLMGPKYESCLNRDRAARYYRTIAGYEVDSDPESIKQEIYKWGPVVAGFKMYDDFVNEYDGISIYTGPKPNAKSQGGHAIEICGWGKEGDIDFWWICNSWGSNWGLGGFFRMKMNIKECELEDNVVAFIPDFPGFTLDMIQYNVRAKPEMEKLRKWMGIDPITGYQFVTIPLIEKGELKGDLQPIFPYNLPDMKTVWLGEASIENFNMVTTFHTFQSVQLAIDYKFSKWLFIVGVLVCLSMIFYFRGRQKI
jgi:hypothetical protein